MATKTKRLNEERGHFEIELNGQKMIGHSNMNSFRLFSNSTGNTLDQLDKAMEKDPMGTLALLAYHACENYCHRNDTDMPISERAFVSYYLDDIEQVKEVGETIMKSLTTQVQNTEGEKK
jgi:hypothetical protein